MAIDQDLFNVGRKKPRVKKPSKYPGETKRIGLLYLRLYRDKFGRKPLVRPHEWAHLKRLIEDYGPALVEQRIAYFLKTWKDDFARRAGYSIAVFYSSWMAIDARHHSSRDPVACHHDPLCQNAAEHTKKTLADLRQSPQPGSSSLTASKPSDPF